MYQLDDVTVPGTPSWCASLAKSVGVDRKRIVWGSGRATVRPWWTVKPIEVVDGDVLYTFPTLYGPAVDEVVKGAALEGRGARELAEPAEV